MHVDAGLGEVPYVSSVGAAIVDVIGVEEVIDLTFESDVGYIASVLQFLERQCVGHHEVSHRIGFEHGVLVFGIA